MGGSDSHYEIVQKGLSNDISYEKIQEYSKCISRQKIGKEGAVNTKSSYNVKLFIRLSNLISHKGIGKQLLNSPQEWQIKKIRDI